MAGVLMWKRPKEKGFFAPRQVRGLGVVSARARLWWLPGGRPRARRGEARMTIGAVRLKAAGRAAPLSQKSGRSEAQAPLKMSLRNGSPLRLGRVDSHGAARRTEN
jgi:hypothetical protein